MADKYTDFLEGVSGTQDAPVNDQGAEDKYSAYLRGAMTSASNIDAPSFTQGPPKEQGAIANAPTIGSLVGGIAGAISGGPVGSVLGTAAGTSLGSSAQQLLRSTGVSPTQAQETPEFLTQQFKDVATQSALDILGQKVMGVGQRAYHAIVPKILPKMQGGVEGAQSLMKEYGSTLTPGQVLEAGQSNKYGITRAAQGLAEHSLLGKQILEGTYKSQDDALKKIQHDILSVDKLSPQDRGNVFIDAIKGGNKALDAIAGSAYKELDNLAASTGATVNISPLKTAATKILSQQERIGGVGLTEQGGELLNKVVKSGDTLSFSDAHAMRSSLLARMRDLSSNDPAKKNIATLVDSLNEQMEVGAKAAGGDLFQKYRDVSSFYKSSISKLNDKYIQTLVKKNPEDIGAAIYQSGNVTEIAKTKAALRRAASLDPSIDYKSTVRTMQQGFIESLLTSRGKLTKEGETQGVALLKDFEDAKMRRTIDAALTPELANKLKQFAQTSQMAQTRVEGPAPFLASIMQAGALASIGHFVFTGDYPGAAAGGAAIVISPAVMAKLLVKPGMVDKLILASKAIPGQTPVAGSFIAKLSNEIREEVKKDKENETPPGP